MSKKRKNKFVKKVKNDIIYLVILFFIKLLRAMDRKSSIFLLKNIGLLAFWFARYERKKTLKNLTMAFGKEKSPAEIKALGLRVFLNLSTCVCDAFRIPILSHEQLDDLVEVEGVEHLKRALAHGKGAFLQTGHFGNWELMGAWMAAHNFPLRVIAKNTYDPRLDKMLVAHRNQAGYANTARGKAIKIIVNGIKNGDLFGLLFDIDTSVKGDFVEFFGKPAHTATMPVILSKQLSAPIVPAFIRLRKNLTYKIVFEEPLNLVETDDSERDVITNTQMCSDVYERWIRKYPEQWIWMHNRWKKKPRVSH